jgi:Holliday junction resolvase
MEGAMNSFIIRTTAAAFALAMTGFLGASASADFLSDLRTFGHDAVHVASDGTKWVVHAAENGTATLTHDAKDGTKDVVHVAKDGSANVVHFAKNGTRQVSRMAVHSWSDVENWVKRVDTARK